MRILALDSSGLVASVAVVEDGAVDDQVIAEYTVNYKKTHSQTLLPMLDEIVKMTELDLHTVDARRVTFLGDGVPVHKTKIKEEILPGEAVTFAPANMNRQRAASVGTLGMQYYKEGKIETAMEHEPDYLRVSQAERERKERLGNV